MNTPRKKTPAGPRAGEASGRHEGLRHPVDDDQQIHQRLDEVGLEDQGDVVEDALRDRRGRGLPGSATRGNPNT